MNPSNAKKNKDSSIQMNPKITTKLYQSIINRVLDKIVYLIDRKNIEDNKLKYAIIRKDHFFIYEDEYERITYNPNPPSWGIHD